MGRFYSVVIHPADGECPLNVEEDGERDCNTCDHCKYIGTLGGEFYVDCELNRNNKDED